MRLADRRRVLCLLAGSPFVGMATAARAVDHEALIVPTAAGTVRGAAENGIRIFTGISFGQATRFGPARPARRWDGVFDATRPAKLAPQLPDGFTFAADTSENCLQLNVWAPTMAGRHPVLVYIHGGANETGWSGDAATAGDRFAMHGVVCVTVNYRLGALGFLETGDLLGPAFAGSGNNGIRDLLLALQWVRINIAAFGGDPARITIAGESAGGKNVGTLLGTPAADGLYRAAAIFSGGAETVHTAAQAAAFARLFAKRLGGAEMLQSASTEAILAAQLQAKTEWPHNFPFRPIVGGRLIPQIPLARIRAGKAPRVPLLIGSNADESRLFLPADQAGRTLAPRSIANESVARMAIMERRYADAFPQLTPADRHWRLLTAEEYGMPGLRIAESHAMRGAPVYRYRFAYPSPGGPFAGHSPHALDVPFTFDHVDNALFANFFGLTPADQPIAGMMHTAAIAFIRDGRPSAPTLPAWPRFDEPARLTMTISAHPRMEPDPDRLERLLWTA